MWDLSNKTPFVAELSAYRDQTGASFWGVWVKASFTLRDGRPPLFLADQVPLHRAPLFAGDSPDGLPLADSDITPPKPLVDLIVAGRAEQPADDDAAPILLRLGGWSKTLWLHPPQRWNWIGRAARDPDATPQVVGVNGLAAFGGAGHPENPVGRGADKDGDAPPCLLTYPDEWPAKGGRGIRAATFGPLARHWPVRARLGGTYDAAWEQRRAPLLPRDFDPAFWQSAPLDQRLPRPVAADAVLEVAGMVGSGPAAQPSRFALPLLDLTTSTRIKGTWHPKTPDLQTIAVDMDTATVTVTYHANWAIARAADDVTMETTAVLLNSTNGFRVAPAHAGLFEGRVQLPEVI